MAIHTSVLSFADFINSQSMLKIIQQEVGVIKNMYVYQDPYQAAYLIKWEINDSDSNWIREDF